MQPWEQQTDFDDDDPNNPTHRDHDLSDSAPYDFDLPADTKPWFLRRWLLLIVSVLLVLSLFIPYILRFQ
jgi:hypothetical protein